MKPEAAQRADEKTQRLIDRALDAHTNNEPWPPKAKRNLTPEQKEQVRRTVGEKAALGREVGELNDIPPKPAAEQKPPARGELFKLAASERVRGELPPMLRKLLIVLAAYADGGNPSPGIEALAARMATTRPNVMWLLRSLELRRWIKVEWTDQIGEPNVYTLKIH